MPIEFTSRDFKEGFWFYRPNDGFPPPGLSDPAAYSGQERLNLIGTPSATSKDNLKLKKRWVDILPHLTNVRVLWVQYKVSQTMLISTYAATAQRHEWITAAMILPCLTLICISILTSRYKSLGDTHLAHIVPLFTGSAISGLLSLASFKETARTIGMLKSSGFDAIRQQSFHDAGLLIFFYSGILLAVLFGILIIEHATDWKSKILGVSVALLGLGAFPLMAIPWPRMIGILSAVPGLKQRASLLSLWLAITLVLAAVSGQIIQSTSRR